MTVIEKVAYLKGLCEGLNLDGATAEGKVLVKIVDILDDMANDIEDLACELEDCKEYCEELDEDLGYVEADLYEDDDDDDCDCCDCLDDDDCYEVECPACGAYVCIDVDDDPSEIKCTECGEVFDCTCDCCDSDDCDCCDCE